MQLQEDNNFFGELPKTPATTKLTKQIAIKEEELEKDLNGEMLQQQGQFV